MYTKDESFSLSANFLLRQNRRCITYFNKGSNPQCSYRNPHGMCCAIGCLIDDRVYDPELEGCLVTEENVTHALELSGHKAFIRFASGELAQQLQQLHDTVSPGDWEPALERLAGTYEVEWTRA